MTALFVRKSDIMNKCNFNSKQFYNQLVDELIVSQKNNSLFFLIGAGVSNQQGYGDWNDYVRKLAEYWGLRNKRYADTLKYISSLAGLSNKRKIDFINQIIKKICNSDEQFKIRCLDFEKKHFGNHQLQINNDILSTLIKFSAIFFTTNYDYEVENAIGSNSIIKDYMELSETDELLPNFVVHLHGEPNGNVSNFINTSDKYLKLYANLDNLQHKLTMFYKKKKNPVLIIIGSGLQEDELLYSMCPDNEISVYALCKYDNCGNNDTISADLASIKEKFYLEKNIKIIWYGKEFSDLSVFCNQLYDDVQHKIMKRCGFITPDELISEAIASKDFSECYCLHKVIEQKNMDLLDAFFTNISNDYFKKLLNDKVFIEQYIAKNYLSSVFLERSLALFNQINYHTRKVIENSIKLGNTWANKSASINIIVAESNNYVGTDKIAFMEEYLCNILTQITRPDEIKNSDVKCLYLLQMLQNDKIFLNTEDYDLSEAFYSRFYRVLINIDHCLNVDQYSFNELREHCIVKKLYTLLFNNKLRFCHSKAFPEFLFKSKLIRRLLINIDLIHDLSNTNLSNLIKYFDYNKQIQGSEVNIFVTKHIKQIQTDAKYINLSVAIRQKIQNGNYYLDGNMYFNNNKDLMRWTNIDTCARYIAKAIHNNSFDINCYQIFHSIINQQIKDESLLNQVFLFDIWKLKCDCSNIINILNFFETDLGRYINILNELENTRPQLLAKCRSKIINNLSRFNNKNICDYLRGKYLPLTGANIRCSVNYLVGYAHSHTTAVDYKDETVFKEPAIVLANCTFNDNYALLEMIVKILIATANPNCIDSQKNNSLFNRNLDRIVLIVLLNFHKFYISYKNQLLAWIDFLCLQIGLDKFIEKIFLNIKYLKNNDLNILFGNLKSIINNLDSNLISLQCLNNLTSLDDKEQVNIIIQFLIYAKASNIIPFSVDNSYILAHMLDLLNRYDYVAEMKNLYECFENIVPNHDYAFLGNKYHIRTKC